MRPGALPWEACGVLAAVCMALGCEGDDRQMAGVAHVVGPRGCSVISDIDDTIKHTQVNDREAVLANTFLRPFRPVPGMPELYRQCAEAGVAFHYVSGSPWQLYVPLAEFLQAEGLPSGSVHLRHFRLQDPSTTLAMLQQTQQATKLEAIRPILQAYPERRFILIGDSGEQDPEIYTAVAGEFAEQVAAIMIRNVTGEELTNARFQPLRDKLADVPLVLFDHPDQVRPLLGELLRQTPGG